MTGKYSQKRKKQPTEIQKMINTEYKLPESRDFIFNLPRVAVRTSATSHLRHCFCVNAVIGSFTS